MPVSACRAPARRVAAVLAACVVLTLLPGTAAQARGTAAWPHFLQVHVLHRSDATRVVVEAGHAGRAWQSQPGVARGDYQLRIDADGYVRSLDAGLAFTPVAPRGDPLAVRILDPGVAGEDVFRFDPAGPSLRFVGAAFAGPQGNGVGDVGPGLDVLGAPLDFDITVGSQCRPNQYLQVAPEWTGYVWRTPDGTPPGTYRVRLNPDGSVVSLDQKVVWSQVEAQPWDRGHQILGVLIVHSCDAAGDGADIAGFTRHPDGTFSHMANATPGPDGGYGWQEFNCGRTGPCRTSPRQPLSGGNVITLRQPPTVPAPLDLSPRRLDAASGPVLSVAVSHAAFPGTGPPQADHAVLARHDDFADGLAGIPLALARKGPLLLSSTQGVESEVIDELRRVVRRGGTVWLLGGHAALGPAVEQTVRQWGFEPRRLAGRDRFETATMVAAEIGPAAHAFLVNGRNFPDALAAGAAAGGADGGAHVLLVERDSVPEATRARLAGGGYRHRTVFGGEAAVNGAAYAAAGAGTRISGPDRDATAARAAVEYFPNAATVWAVDGGEFVAGVTAGAMAAARSGPLLLLTGRLGDTTRQYLGSARPQAAFAVGGIDEATVATAFTRLTH